MKNVYVLVFDGLADWEVGLIDYELNARNSIKVTTVGFTNEPITTGGGLKILPEVKLSSIEPGETALLMLPGGLMWESVYNRELAGLVMELHESGALVAAVCGATAFLAKTGIFKKGIQHTSNSLEYLQEIVPEYHEEALYRDTYAVSDQGVITAGGEASVEFAYQVLKALHVYDDEVLGEFAEFWGCRGLA